jgi:ankyrin repeat protein
LWINGVTNCDSFTPCHFASFKGNISAIEDLIKYGVDVHKTNAFGLNMMHVASQGDQAPSLYLFRRMKVDINTKDDRGSTPLHWACYSHSEIALSYLLAWSPLLDEVDQEG